MTIVTTLVDPVDLFVGDAVSIQPAIASAGIGTFTYSISPSVSPYGLNFSTSGLLSGTPTSSLAATSMTVTAVDSSSSSSGDTFVLSISHRTPVTYDVSRTVDYNSSGNAIAITADHLYTSAAIIGAASHGVAQASGASITYTPTTGWNGSDSFTYRVTGPGGTSNISTVSITVSSTGVSLSPSLASGSLGRGITTTPINPVTLSATGGAPGYTTSITSGGLPPGLSLLFNTISGTPTTVGEFNFSITTTDSSLPTPFSVTNDYTINVLRLSEVVNLLDQVQSSKFTQQSKFWNKTPYSVSLQESWRQWGLYRSYIGSPVPGWGSDSIQNALGTVDLQFSGQNVDVVIIALGSADPGHPEFAVNADGSGGTRIKYYDWLAGTGTKYIDKTYHSHNANAAAAVTSIVAGNTYGWARNANIYTLDYSAMPASAGNPAGNATALVQAFQAVSKFHSTKVANTITGVQNPTIVICNQFLTLEQPSPSNITNVAYRETFYNGPFTADALASLDIPSPFVNSTGTAYSTKVYLPINNANVTAAVNQCTAQQGLVVVGAAGDYGTNFDISSGADYNNRTTINGSSLVYYSQGSSPSNAAICVGAADSTVVETIASFSASGAGVNLYAPGSDLMAAINNKVGVSNPYFGGVNNNIPDPRKPRYAIGKVSGTAYAAAQVAGVLACLAQVKPKITQSEALSYLQSNAGVNQLTTGTNVNTQGTSVSLYKATNNAYGAFMNTYGVWPNSNLYDPQYASVTVDLYFTAAIAGNYTMIISSDNDMSVYVNGSGSSSIDSGSSFRSSQSTPISLNQGVNTVRCVVTNYSGPAAFAVVIQDLFGNHIFETSPTLPVSLVPISPDPVQNLYLFGPMPTITETARSFPKVATNQPFDITIDGGVSNGAFYYQVKNVTTGTQILTSYGNFTLTNQVFTTPGIKTYDLYFANTTDRLKLAVEVIDHDRTKVISSYTQTGKQWNKTPAYIPPDADWLNWGLLRSSTSTNALDWGSDSTIVNASGTITVPYAGLNVDVVVIDSGSIDPNHPEFALYPDGTGGSRVKYYNWNGSYPREDVYNISEANRAAATAGIIAGNSFGWARAANIYSLNYSLVGGVANAFKWVTNFHNSKPINPVTKFKNPTVVVCEYNSVQTAISTAITSVTYQGTVYTGPFNQTQLSSYGILAPFATRGDNTIYTVVNSANDYNITNWVNTATSAGVIVVGSAGDYSSYITKTTTGNYLNYYNIDATQYFYHQGSAITSATDVIVVGALDSTVEQQKAKYSGNGAGIDIFAPGSDQLTAFNTRLGVTNKTLNTDQPATQDTRNPDYYVGKDSSVVYAAANVAGYVACLAQVDPTLTPADAKSLVVDNAAADILTDSIIGYGVNNDINGANNLVMQAVFPNYDEKITAFVNGVTATTIALGEYFDIYITGGAPNTYFSYAGSDTGLGQLDETGSAVINTFALINRGVYVYKFYFASTNHSVVLTFNVTPSVTLNSSNIIYANHFDRVQNRISYLINDIYGATTASSDVYPGFVVTATSWDYLCQDIVRAFIHQNGSTSTLSLPVLSTQTRVTAKELNNLSNVIDDLVSNSEQIAANQLVTTTNVLTINTATNGIYNTYQRTYHWTTSSSFPVTARNFFNLGGYIEVSFQNPYLGTQKGYFTLTDYISGTGDISLAIPGGNIVSTLSVDGINGNTATVTTVVAPNLGNTAIATGTVQVYVSTDVSGGIAGQTPTYIDAPLAQGQLGIQLLSQFITLNGDEVTTQDFTVYNSSPDDITITDISVIHDPNRPALGYTINTAFPFIVPANTAPSSPNLSVSYQNLTVGGRDGLYENSIEIISDGPNPLLKVATPIETYFGIAVTPDPFTKTVTKATTATFNIVSYAGSYSSYSASLPSSITGLQIINPGLNYTYYSLDDTPGKITMGLLLYNSLFVGGRAPSTTGAIKSPFPEPILVVDVASVPNQTTSTQVTVTAFDDSTPPRAVSTTVDVEILVDSEDYHMGHWLSPQNKMNGVMGFSYDVINGQRCLTVGFGMGGGGSCPLYQSDRIFETSQFPDQGYGIYSSYAIQQLGRKFQTQISTGTMSAAIGAWNTGTANTSTFNTSTEITAYSPIELVNVSTSPYGNAFLSTYGVWTGQSSSATNYTSTSAFLARNGGVYSYYYTCDCVPASNDVTSSFNIDGGSTIASIAKSSGITSGTFELLPGLHDITLNANQTGGVDAFAGVALTILNEDGYVVWCTLDPMLPTWAEIGRIFLEDDGKPHNYQVSPNVYSVNIANSTSYATYFENNSIVSVSDNGEGKLSISLNRVVAVSNDSITDSTLSNVPYLFYYSSNSENQTENNKRFNNYQTTGQYVKYFTGFDQYGNVKTKQVLAPGFIAPPQVILATYEGAKKQSVWKKVAIDLVKVAIVAYGVAFAIAAYTAITLVGGATILWSTVAAVAWETFVGWVVAVTTCFTKDTKVEMADGSIKDIKDIKVGDRVFNYDKTAINTVTHLEVIECTELIGLYSPSRDIPPFATINHPLYVNGTLSSPVPNEIYKAYPWLGMTSKIEVARSGPMHPGEIMYNLWVDGDSTYTVNGYGTTSIIGDGAILRLGYEYGFINQERITELFAEFIDAGPEIAFGGYLMNKYLGKIKFKPFVKLAIGLYSKPKESKVRQAINKVAKFIGKRALKHQEKQSKK